jgi:hypothetical protein
MGDFVIENNVSKSGWTPGYDPDEGAQAVTYESLEEAQEVLGMLLSMDMQEERASRSIDDYRIRNTLTGEVYGLFDEDEDFDLSDGNEYASYAVEIQEADGTWGLVQIEDEATGEMMPAIVDSMDDAVIAVILDIVQKNGPLPEDQESVRGLINNGHYRVRNLDNGKVFQVSMPGLM